MTHKKESLGQTEEDPISLLILSHKIGNITDDFKIMGRMSRSWFLGAKIVFAFEQPAAC